MDVLQYNLIEVPSLMGEHSCQLTKLYIQQKGGTTTVWLVHTICVQTPNTACLIFFMMGRKYDNNYILWANIKPK